MRKDLGGEKSIVNDQNLWKILGYKVLARSALVIEEMVVTKGPQSYDKIKSILR